MLDQYGSCAAVSKRVGEKDGAEMSVMLSGEKEALVSCLVIAVDGHTENPEPRA